MTNLVETVAWLIEIPSVTGGEAALRDAIADRLADLPHQVVADSLIVGDPAEGVVLLAGHLDTVPLQGQVGAIVSEDRVHGLGATDMKGGLAVMIHLVETLGPSGLACVFYAGEEGPLSGNQLGFVLEAAPWLTSASAGIVLEPTDRAVEAGCQGVINADVTFLGEPAHSARPWLGDNAVTKAGEFLTRMHALQPELHLVEGLEFREVITVTTAYGGVARNVVPSEFVLNVNYRFAPDRAIGEATERLAAVCAGADRIEVTDVAPAGAVDIGHPLFQALIHGSGAAVVGKQGWTDVAQLGAAGIPAVNFGPGEPSLAHKPGESVRISDLTWVYDSLLDILR
ncbi:MAG TPA: succinyl-diaminopimelate desuccinylase [Acidimicrobiia bacterium]|nr:succinyl-diaminopimelate desuccinylase [Acidimicrobiia bacterium]